MKDVIEQTIATLGLRKPRHAWTPDGPGPLLKAELDPVLLPATMLPFDASYDEWVVVQFPKVDQLSARAQLEASFENVTLIWGAPSRVRAPDAQRMRIQLGAPIVGRDRWFIRVRLSNAYRSGRGPTSHVDDDRYAWFHLDGRPLQGIPPLDGAAWRPF